MNIALFVLGLALGFVGCFICYAKGWLKVKK